jgi:2-polyprenyl-3-methyl-5-hydroxy-6-metoxy-1,4-benzoquinol methylase
MGDVDVQALRSYSLLLFSKLEGAVTAGMVHLGDRLGLYTALADAEQPMSSAQLASVAGLDERWVREWLRNQGAARLIEFDDDERYRLSPEGAAVLARPEHPAYGAGWFQQVPDHFARLRQLPECFRTGLGYDYDAHGPEGAAGVERAFEPWYRNFLVPVALPALDGVVDKLVDGAVVADVGCGAGVAASLIAEAFPASEVHGYEVSRHALTRARERAERLGLPNVHFHDVREERLPSDARVDLVTTFDCLHDMTQPDDVVRAIRHALSPEGVWLLVDTKARDTYAENVAKNPMAALMYGVSVLSCLASALSEPGGAGLGTLGLPEDMAREMAEAAGFTRFRRLDVDHPINAFYEIRP